MQNNLPVIVINEVDTVTKSHDLANAMITALKSGNINPIEFAVKRKLVMDAMEEVFKDEDVRQILINDIQSYGREKPKKYGAEVSIRATGKYDYSKDETWAAIKAEMAPMEERLKKQEELVKSATKSGGAIVDSDTGDILAQPVPYPATDSIVVKLPK